MIKGFGTSAEKGRDPGVSYRFAPPGRPSSPLLYPCCGALQFSSSNTLRTGTRERYPRFYHSPPSVPAGTPARLCRSPRRPMFSLTSHCAASDCDVKINWSTQKRSIRRSGLQQRRPRSAPLRQGGYRPRPESGCLPATGGGRVHTV